MHSKAFALALLLLLAGVTRCSSSDNTDPCANGGCGGDASAGEDATADAQPDARGAVDGSPARDAGSQPAPDSGESPDASPSTCGQRLDPCTRTGTSCCSGMICSTRDGICRECGTNDKASGPCGAESDCCNGFVCGSIANPDYCCKPAGTCGWDATCKRFSGCCEGEVCDIPDRGFNTCPAGKTSTCHPPNTPFANCKPLTGCGGGLICGTAKYPELGKATACVQPCASGANCTKATESCQKLGLTTNVCARNDCGPGVDSTRWFAACDGHGTSDGTCMPDCFGVCSPTSTAVIGRCYAAGNAPAGAVCTIGAADCVRGAMCVQESTGSFCRTVCDPYGRGGPTCQTGTCKPADVSHYWGYCR